VAEALGTVGQVLAESRVLLQDQFTPYRYPDKDIVEGINIALAEVRRLRPDLLLPAFTIPYFDTSGTIDATKPIGLDSMYRSSLVYYVVGRMQLRDDENTTDARAASLLNKFVSQMTQIVS